METVKEKCGDNRFEVIQRAKEHLLEATNIETSPNEMKVLDSFLFRAWQMEWLRQYEPTLRNATDTNGKWVHDEDGCWYCPKCGCTPAYWEAKDDNQYGLPPYCHSCGAKLELPKGVQ